MRKKSGLTLVEILVTMGLIGLVALLVAPKFLSSGNQKNRDAIAKEVFTTVGELFLACQDSGNCKTADANWATSAMTDGANNTFIGVNNQFSNYLQSHMDIVDSTPTVLPFRIATGAQVESINVPISNLMAGVTKVADLNHYLVVTLSVPGNPNFDVYFVTTDLLPEVSRVTRYSTKFGVTGTATDKTWFDTSVLKI